MRQTGSAITLALFIALTAACSKAPDHTPILTCEAANGIEPDCRFSNPEDIVVSPSGRQLLISQMASLDGSGRGSIVALTPESGEIVTLFPSKGAPAGPTSDWGSPDCPHLQDPGAIVPHGLDIERRDDGRHELFAVNHGERESVELFEVIESNDSVALEYRGCVAATGDMAFNDVVGHADGGFWVSHTYPRGANQTLGLLRLMWTSYAPGKVYAWRATDGFSEIAGSQAKYANGVEKSADERYLYVNSYFGNEVIKVDVREGKRVGSVTVPSPDNLAWSADGELLAAGHDASLSETKACLTLTEGSCGIRFEILAIDPDTMTARSIFSNVGAPMGAATVARPHGDYLYLGTFAGDRIGRISADLLAR